VPDSAAPIPNTCVPDSAAPIPNGANGCVPDSAAPIPNGENGRAPGPSPMANDSNDGYPHWWDQAVQEVMEELRQAEHGSAETRLRR
ncbi:MAG TPA: hypothetical protein VKE94_00695, partial [Gemmataceae bacterium]|nr:hypothetical protein [Gemmataceae bacterium]